MICNVYSALQIHFTLFGKRLRTYVRDYRLLFFYRKGNYHGYFVKNCKFCLNIVRALGNIFPYLS